MSVERGNAVGWDSPESLQLLLYSSPCLCLGCMVLKPSGSTATLVPQSAFFSQAAITAKTWQVSMPWHGHGGQQMGQAPTILTSAPDLSGCSRVEQPQAHRLSLLPKTPSAEKEKGAQRWEPYTHQPRAGVV